MNGAERIYRACLRLYPSAFRQEYGDCLLALFRDMRRDAERSRGGYWRLYVLIACDLLVTIPKQHLLSRGHRRANLMDTTQFDAQLTNYMSFWTFHLRSGYSIKQIMELIIEKGEEPLATEFKTVLAELEAGVDAPTALANLKARMPSARAQLFVNTFLAQFEEGGNLADRLEDIMSSIRHLS